MKRVLMALFVFGLCALPATAAAQEKDKMAVTFAHPSAVGLLWHTSETVAVRPDLTFSTSETDTGMGKTMSKNLGVGISLLLYMKKWDQVSAYFSPRYGLARATGTSQSISGNEVKSSLTSHALSGSFGVQAWIGTRFSAFGEAGLTYTSSTSDSAFLEIDTKTTSFGTRSGVGVAFYF